MPDGSIVRGVPEGTPREEVLRVWRQATRRRMGQGEDVARAIAGAPLKVATGLAGLPRFLADASDNATGWLLEKLGADPAKVEASRVRTPFSMAPSAEDVLGAVDDVSRSLGVPETHRPQTRSGKTADTIAQGLFGAFVPGGNARTMRGLFAQGAGGVTGAGAAELAASEGAGPAGQLLAAMAGGTAATAAVAPPVAAAQAVKPFTRRGQEAEVGQRLFMAAKDPEQALRNIIASAQEPGLPGVQPTLAEVAGDEGLAILQRSLRSGDPAIAGQLSERLTQNAQGRASILDELEAPGPGATAVRDAARTRLDQFVSNTDAARARAEGRVDPYRMGVPEPPEATGAAIRESLEDAYGATRARTSAAYRDPALDVDLPAAEPVARQFGRMTEVQNEFYGAGGGLMPPELETLLREVYDAERPTVAMLTRWDQRLGDLAGGFSMRGQRRDATAAGRLREALQEAMLEAMPPQARALLEAAKGQRRAQGETFETGATGRVLATDRYGRPRVEDERVAANLFAGRDQVAEAQRLKKAMGGEAADAFRRYMAGQIERAVDPATGRVNRRLLERVRAQHAGSLRAFPEVGNEVADLARAQALVDRLGSRQARTREAFERSAFGLFAGNADPDRLVAEALRARDAPTRLRRLKEQTAKTPEAQAGLRRAIVDHLLSEGQMGHKAMNAGTAVSEAALSKALRRYAPALRQSGLFTERQTRAMERILADLERSHASTTAAMPQGSPTIQNNSALKFAAGTVPGAGRIMFALDAVKRALDTDGQRQALLLKAALDPQYAAKLMSRPSARGIQQLLDDLKVFMGGTAKAGLVTGDAER